LGRFDEAERELTKVYEIQRKLYGERAEAVGTTLVSLGTLDTSRGDYSRAKQRLELGLEILTEVHGGDSQLVAVTLGKIGLLARIVGEYREAEHHLREALQIMQRLFGEHHPEVANRTVALATLYRDKGDLDAAENMYWRAVEVLERHPSPEYLATALNDLGSILIDRGQFDKAEQCTARALAIRQRLFGSRNFFVAQSTNNLAEIHRLQGHYEKAGPLYDVALESFEAVLGSGHPEVATVLGNIGLIRHVLGNYAAAEEAFQRAAEIQEATLGDGHVSFPRPLISHAMTCWAQGSTSKALTLLNRAGEARERSVQQLLSAGSDRQRIASRRLWVGETDITVAFHIDGLPDDDASLALAFTTVLRRKGRVLDELARTAGAFHRHVNNGQDQELRNELAAMRTRLATERDGRMLQALQFEEEQLQRELSERSPISSAETQAASLDQVLSRLPEGGALVEFFKYHQVDPRKDESSAFQSSHYVAYVLRRHGPLEWVDLGDGTEIDRLVEAFRRALSEKTRSDVKELARALDERVMQPVRPFLQGAQRILLSPDGSLNLVPFAALVDESGDWLVTRYTISYLSSGRDLLRFGSAGESQSAPVVVAGPNYFMHGVEQSRRQWRLLPRTLGQADLICELFPDSVPLTHDKATEEALLNLRGPRILHVATHGYFDAEAPGVQSDDDNPLLRSGLILAGANGAPVGDQDGVLTALEVAGLNLWGTQLAVLSACETGLGGLIAGEGIAGLRRSLVLAGAESQLISLWQVSSAATGELMRGYYKRLQAGCGRAESLCARQREMLATEDRSHPYYWAAFILSGASHPLPAVAPVQAVVQQGGARDG
jgi:CHAT domain-containing protein/Tfp pilus assembly protein PilF